MAPKQTKDTQKKVIYFECLPMGRTEPGARPLQDYKSQGAPGDPNSLPLGTRLPPAPVTSSNLFLAPAPPRPAPSPAPQSRSRCRSRRNPQVPGSARIREFQPLGVRLLWRNTHPESLGGLGGGLELRIPGQNLGVRSHQDLWGRRGLGCWMIRKEGKRRGVVRLSLGKWKVWGTLISESWRSRGPRVSPVGWGQGAVILRVELRHRITEDH